VCAEVRSKAIELKADYIDAYYARAGIFFAYDRDYDRAIADYGKIIEVKPDYVAAYVGRAIAYGRKGEHRRVKSANACSQSSSARSALPRSV
jgi:tetratricopeptide (TPR) repeat protein